MTMKKLIERIDSIERKQTTTLTEGARQSATVSSLKEFFGDENDFGRGSGRRRPDIKIKYLRGQEFLVMIDGKKYSLNITNLEADLKDEYKHLDDQLYDSGMRIKPEYLVPEYWDLTIAHDEFYDVNGDEPDEDIAEEVIDIINTQHQADLAKVYKFHQKKHDQTPDFYEVTYQKPSPMKVSDFVNKNQDSGTSAGPGLDKQQLGTAISRYFDKILSYDDSGLTVLDRIAKVWDSLYTKHNGNIDSIIANEPADVLMKVIQEFKQVLAALGQGLKESRSTMKKSKNQKQGMAEGLDIDFNKNFAYQRDIAKKSPAYVTGFKDGYHNKPKNDMEFPSGDERKNYKLGYRDGQSGHTKRVDVMGKKGVAETHEVIPVPQELDEFPEVDLRPDSIISGTAPGDFTRMVQSQGGRDSFVSTEPGDLARAFKPGQYQRTTQDVGLGVEESKAKPDFLDLDKDGNRKETMKKAAADKKKNKTSVQENRPPMDQPPPGTKGRAPVGPGGNPEDSKGSKGSRPDPYSKAAKKPIKESWTDFDDAKRAHEKAGSTVTGRPEDYTVTMADGTRKRFITKDGKRKIETLPPVASRRDDDEDDAPAKKTAKSADKKAEPAKEGGKKRGRPAGSKNKKKVSEMNESEFHQFMRGVMLIEEKMSPEQKAEKERIVKGMKKSSKDLKKRYGSRWQDVMHATATKKAMESVGSKKK